MLYLIPYNAIGKKFNKGGDTLPARRGPGVAGADSPDRRRGTTPARTESPRWRPAADPGPVL